jgi:hypothetical protein
VAVVLVFRLAVAVAPAVYRVCRTNGCDANAWANGVAREWAKLHDPTAAPATITTELNAGFGPEGGTAEVTDYGGTFEMRKLQVRFQRTPPGGVIEDIDVCTMHFLKAPGGVPTDTWDTSDYTTLETALGVWWGALKALYINTIALGQYRWYASGPAWDITPAPYNPARRVTELNVVGTAAGTSALPPQVAMSVTSKTATRPTWGRFYMPSPATANITAEGIMPATVCDLLAASTVTLFNTARAASLWPVVFTRARGEYTRRDGTVLPAKTAAAHVIEAVQVDNIFDIVRSRRWATTTYRKITTLT